MNRDKFDELLKVVEAVIDQKISEALEYSDAERKTLVRDELEREFRKDWCK